MKKKTYGQQVMEHRSKQHSDDDDVIEYRRKIEPEIIKNIHETIAKAKDQDQYRGKDFYICLLMKTERMGNIPRTFVLARKSCPTPTYQQSVWKYHRNSGELEFLWAIPEKILYYHIYHNAHKYIQDKECAGLAKFILLMESGELEEWVIKENGEKPDGVIRYKTEEELNI
jgi:hypothetical protein